MKTKGVSLLGNTNELQDLISDLHSYPAALYIPLLHNHNKWGITVKTIEQAFLWYQKLPIIELRIQYQVIYNIISQT